MRQSGLTPQNIKQLKIKNVEKILEPYTPTPCKIDIPQKIQKGKFRKPPAFIGYEATKYLKQYLKIYRNNLTSKSHLFTLYNNPNKEINTKDVNITFRIAAQELKKEEINTNEYKKGKLNELKLSSLTKFYKTTAKYYLTEIKNNPNKDDKFYKNLYENKAITLLETETDTEILTKIKKQENENKKLKDRIETIENRVFPKPPIETPITDGIAYHKKLKEERLKMSPEEIKQEQETNEFFQKEQEEEEKDVEKLQKLLKENPEEIAQFLINQTIKLKNMERDMKYILERDKETKK